MFSSQCLRVLRREPLRRLFSPACHQVRASSDVAERLRCSRAIVGSVTESFVRGALRYDEPTEPINLERARQQHAVYVDKLKELIPEVVQLPPDERFPDFVYVEDPAVVVDDTALITQMLPPTRAEEVVVMEPVLAEMGFKIVHMKEEPGAYLDGGDVMFTGREFLVGLSQRTNAAGVECLAKAFPEIPVTGIRVEKGVLHLKSMSSLAGVDLIAISSSQAAQKAWRDIEANAKFRYRKLVFPDNNGANCLFINGTVLHPPKEEYPASFEVWQTLDCPRMEVPNAEMAKCDGSLTCNSIRLK